MNRLRVALLAGGRGVRMEKLGHKRPKPLIPYGGMCHLIDFSISNVYQSGIDEILLLSQYKDKQLVRYLMETWAFSDTFRVHFGPFNDVYHENIDSVFKRVKRAEEFGTADALIKNNAYIFSEEFTDVMVLHSDHVYNFHYQKMLDYHRKENAALTIGYKEIDREDVKLFGMVEVDRNENLLSFVEKPTHPKCNTVFTAVCIFNSKKLIDYLDRLQKTNWNYDVSKDIIPAMLQGREVIKCFYFQDHWEDIGTVKRYYQSNMNLLKEDATFCYDDLPLTLYTEIKRHFIKEKEKIKNTVVAENARCEGTITNSIIYPYVFISKDSYIRDSIILPGARIEGKSYIENAIIIEDEMLKDKQVTII